jgi:hypothetical protein
MTNDYKVGSYAGVNQHWPANFSYYPLTYPSQAPTIMKTNANLGYPRYLGRRSLTTDLSGTSRSIERPPVFIQDERAYPTPPYPPKYYSGVVREGVFPLTGAMYGVNDIDMASIKAKHGSDIYSAQAGFAGGVFLGEIRETIRLLRNPISSFVDKTINFAHTARQLKLKYGRTQKLLRALATPWLVYNYGVLPLTSDIENGLDNLQNILERRTRHLVDTRIQDEETSTIRGEYTLTGGWHTPFLVNVTRANSYRGKSLIKITPSGPVFSNEKWGLRMEDFVPTIYELIPFSFVVDYFTNLNEVLNGVFVEWDQVIYSWVGGEAVDSRETYIFPDVLPDHYRVKGEFPPTTIKTRHVQREDFLNETAGLSALRTELPKVRQVFNLAALVTVLTPLR